MTAPSLWAARATPTGSPFQRVSHIPSSPSTLARIRAGVALLGTSCTGRRRHERLLRPQLPHDPMCPRLSQQRCEGQEQMERGLQQLQQLQPHKKTCVSTAKPAAV